MPKITYVTTDQREIECTGTEGQTVMEIAIAQSVPGIAAECGGACSCATCHVYVDPAWAGRVVPANIMEEDMLEMATDLQDNSRLSCQIRLTAELDGLKVHVASSM